MSSSPTPLPELETQLIDAARRLDAGEASAPAAPRRRWWRHGSTLIAIGAIGLGTGVAVARVAEIGPFAYLARFSERDPKLAPASVITVQPAGAAPAWQARAYVNGLGRLCITGGPRDLRTNPTAKPTKGNLNNPPVSGQACAPSEEIAQTLVDSDWPGSTFAGSSALDGDPDGGAVRVVRGEGGYRTAPPTRLLVYAVAAAGTTPVVQFAAGGPRHPMRPSVERLRMKVDKSPQGLDAAERRLVARYPDELELRLWAAEVAVPEGVDSPQPAFASEFVPHGVPDDTIEIVGIADMRRLIRENRERGWTYTRHINRDPTAVRSETASQRKRIAAFARPRTARDAVPGRFRNEQRAWERIQFASSRRLSVAGGGVDTAWLAPGGVPEDVPSSFPQERTCFVGASILGQCKSKPQKPGRPVVETIVCSPSLNRSDESMVWALSPPGATRVAVTGPGAQVQQLDAAELIAVRRPEGDRISSLAWTWPDGRSVSVRAPWPKRMPRCGNTSPGWSSYRLDSDNGSSMAGGPRPKLIKSAP